MLGLLRLTPIDLIPSEVSSKEHTVYLLLYQKIE